jgi:hypothetical protein
MDLNNNNRLIIHTFKAYNNNTAFLETERMENSKYRRFCKEILDSILRLSGAALTLLRVY